MASLLAPPRRFLRPSIWPLLLVPVLLPFGRSSELGTLACVIGLLVLVARSGWQGLHRWPSTSLLMVLLSAYVGAALFSAPDALVPAKSWSTVASLLRYLPLGLYACLVLRDEGRLRVVYLVVAVLVGVWTFAAWLQMLTGWNMRGATTGVYLTGMFGDDLKFGPTLAVLSPFALWAVRGRWGWRGLLLAFVLLLGPVLLAGARSAWLCYALVALVFAWREAASLRRFAVLCGVGLILLALAGGVAWKTSARFDARVHRTLALFQGSEHGLDTALTGRLDIWRTTVRMIAAHPFNGVGVRGFRYAYPSYAPADDHFVMIEPCGPGQGACHPHQLVLEVLAGTGVLGLLLWLAASAWAIRAWRQVCEGARRQAFPVTVALAAMLFPLNTHLAFYSAWWGLLFAWLLALWCAALYAEAKNGDAVA